MAQLRYKIDVYAAGIFTSTGSIAFTLQTSQLVEPPTIGGQLVRAGEGIVESQPCKVRVLDTNSSFTARISSTASGRRTLLGRLARVRFSLDSTANYSTIFTGRLTDLQLNPDIVSWDVTLTDERTVERNTQIFNNANTAALMPRGVIGNFQAVPAIPPQAMHWHVAGRISTRTNVVGLAWAGDVARGAPYGPYVRIPTPSGASKVVQSKFFTNTNTDADVAQFIIHDVATSAHFIALSHSGAHGNFRTLRWHSNSANADAEVADFGFGLYTQNGVQQLAVDPVYLWKTVGQTDPTKVTGIDIVWSTATMGAYPAFGTTLLGYLYAPAHVPSGTIPLHIGGQYGVHPFQLARDIYDGKYNPTGSTNIKVRYSTAAFDKLTRDPTYARVWFRITSPQLMSDFLNRYIYGPYNVAPLIDAQGRIAPAPMRLPTSTELPLTPVRITSTNALTPPTWESPSREAVTVAQVSYETYSFQMDKDGYLTFGGSADGMNTVTFQTTRLSDNTSAFGRYTRAYGLGAVSITGPPLPIEPPSTAAPYPNAAAYAEVLTSYLAQNLFLRFADGPLYSQLDCHRSVDQTTNGTVQTGMFVKMAVGTWPNPFTRTRSTGVNSTRWMQVIQRQDLPTGPRLRLLDVGPPAMASTHSGLLFNQSTNDTRHGIVLGFTSVPNGHLWQVLVAHTTSTGASAPASSSPRWKPLAVGSSKNLLRILGQLPAGTKWYAKSRQVAAGKPYAAWSTVTSVVTAKLPGTTSLVSTGLTAGTAILKFSKGAASSLYAVDVLLDKSTVATNLGTSRRVGTAAPYTTRFFLNPLSSGSKHIVGVRYRDPWGGKSTMKTVIVSTTGKTKTTSPAPILITNPRLF